MRLKKLIRFFCAIINYYYEAISIFHHPGKKVIRRSYLVSFTEPEQQFLEKCAHSFNYNVDYTRGFRQKELFTVQLTDVVFLGNSGALIWQDKVITESVFDQMRLVKSPAFRSPALLWPRRQKGQYTSLMHLPWAEKSNYHWFLDALPRLFLILPAVTEPLTLIVPQNIPLFQLETLEFVLAGEPNINIMYIRKNEKWRVPEFILPAYVANHYSGYLPANILRELREKIWRGYGVTNDEKSPKRIYISRGKAPKRKVLNETQVIAALQPYAVEIIYAEDLTYREQVQLFYNAEVVIAPHGAGLTNVLFSQQAIVLELHPADVVKSHYFMLCKGLEFPYFYTIGSNSDTEQNFTVNIPDLQAQLRCILAG